MNTKYNLTKIINARGTFTPLGVSRSTEKICSDVSNALSEFFLMDELQELASQKIVQLTGSEAGCVTHCTSASISMSIAAVMTGSCSDKIALLPDTSNMNNKVIIPKGHVVNYGHSILQDIKLTGATPIIIGKDMYCSISDLEKAFKLEKISCLLLVSSRLVKDKEFDFKEAILVAKKYNVPVIIDAAAQDFRCKELLSLEADLILHSGQKYLLSPTAGIVYGKKELVDAVYSNEKGIGRSMKATKESIIGVISAIDERLNLNIEQWATAQNSKLIYFMNSINKFTGLNSFSIADYTGLPFCRACISVDKNILNITTQELAKYLKSHSPQIWTIDNECENNKLIFELLPLSLDEINIIIERIKTLISE